MIKSFMLSVYCDIITDTITMMNFFILKSVFLILIVFNHQIDCLRFEVKRGNFKIVIANIDKSIIGMDDPDPMLSRIFLSHHHTADYTGYVTEDTNEDINKIPTKITVSSEAAKRFGDLYMFTIYAETEAKLITIDLVMVEYSMPTLVVIIPYCNILPIEEKSSEFDNTIDFKYDTFNKTNIIRDAPVNMEIPLEDQETPTEEFIGSPFKIKGIEYNEIYQQFNFLTEVKSKEAIKSNRKIWGSAYTS